MADDVSPKKAREALSRLDPHMPRDEWAKVAMALKAGFGEDGWTFFDDWSAGIGEEYKVKDARTTWKSVREFGAVQFASLVHWAKVADPTYKPGRDQVAKLDPAAKAAADAAREERRKLVAEQDAEDEAAARIKAQKRWMAGTPCTEHPYLTRKGILPHGTRICAEWPTLNHATGEVERIANVLMIPMMGDDGKIHSLQGITPEGDKLYLYGGAKSGKFFRVGGKPFMNEDGKPVVLVAEGFATAASLHEATGHLTFCCFDLGNAVKVGKSMHEAKPDADIVMCADNDAKTKDNPGITKFQKLAFNLGLRMAVPPPGDFNDLDVAAGPDEVAATVAMAEVPKKEKYFAPPVDDGRTRESTSLDVNSADVLCGEHFDILGFDGLDYFIYHKKKKQVLSFRAEKLVSETTQNELAGRDFWTEHFSPEGGGKVDRQLFGLYVYEVAQKRGVFDRTKARGRGAWMDQERVVYHHGNRLSVDGVRMEVNEIQSSFVYPQAEKLPMPADVEMTAEEGVKLGKMARLMRWEQPSSANLLLGWAFLAPVCGILKWRPHLWITGPAGVGKSSIQTNFVNRLLAKSNHYADGSSTEPGIRQILNTDARPVLIDEFEPTNEKTRLNMEPMLTLIRQASSSSEATTAKGSADGNGVRYHIQSMFLLSSINPLLQKDSDKTRITELKLRPLSGEESAEDDAKWQKLEALYDWLGGDDALPQRMLARSINRIKDIQVAVAIFAKAASKKFGNQRDGDQFGTLLAGQWVACHDELPTAADAEKVLDSFDWKLHREVGPDDQQEAINEIIQYKVRLDDGQMPSIFELLRDAKREAMDKNVQTEFGAGIAQKILGRYSMEVRSFEGKLWWVIMPNKPIQKIIKDLPAWADPRATLKRIKGHTTFDNKARRINGVSGKVIGLPLNDYVLNEDPNQPPL